jgi:hypothetical protein
MLRREMSPCPRQVNLELTPVFTPVEISHRFCLTHIDELRTSHDRYEVRIGWRAIRPTSRADPLTGAALAVFTRMS